MPGISGRGTGGRGIGGGRGGGMGRKNRKILIMQLVPFNNHKWKFTASLSAAAFGPTSSEGHVLDKIDKEQANISSWLALFCWLHKAYCH